jgi:GAF domain-containing protein
MTADIYSSTLETLARALEGYCFPTATFVVENAALKLLAVSNLDKNFNQAGLQRQIIVNPGQLQERLLKLPQSLFWLNGDEKIFNVSDEATTIPELFDFASQLGFDKVSFLQVSSKTGFYGLTMVGCYKDHTLSQKELQPYKSLIQLACIAIEKAAFVERAKNSIRETEALSAIAAAIKTPWDTTAFFAALHEQIKQSIGDYAFTGALYDEKTDSIRIPYMYEEGAIQSIESFPLGEGLTSVLLRTKQPLLLVENTEEQSRSLGAKVIGKPAKSWMGAPLIIEDQAIGVLIVQDLEKEKAFTQDHLEYLAYLSRQVAAILFNARLLDEHRNQIAKIQTAAEIARDISSALTLDELLLKAVNLIHDRFNFYHAAIFLVDNAGVNAVVREATGDAGAQMKRTGHKLSIGSKSVVGFVAGQGESLVVNDTTQDATHLPNPLLPDTRAEAAIPLKIGERILGVLDVQSTTPFAFSPNDLNTLQILADQLAIAVNNTELFAETQEHLSQHRLLHHITTSAASGTTLEESLTSTVKGLQVTLGGDRVAILLSDTERKNLVTKAWVGYSEEATNLTVPFGSGITGWVAAHRRPLRVDDIRQDARYIEVSSNTRSELALPLIFQNDILGVLNVESEQVAAYTENDEEMLGTLAGSLAAIIANARLVEQIRKQAERERLLYEITSKIRRSTDIQTILSTTINEISRATGARKTQISVGIEKGEAGLTKVKPSTSKDR